VLSSGHFFFNELLLPAAARQYNDSWAFYLKRKSRLDLEKGEFVYQQGNNVIYIEDFNPRTNTAIGISLQYIKNAKIEYRIDAQSMEYDSLAGKWQMENLVKRDFFKDSLSYTEIPLLSMNLDFKPKDIIDAESSRFMNVVKVGDPLGVFYGAQYAGVDPENGDAIWFVNEQDENGNIVDPTATTNDFDAANFIVLGHPTPDKMYALTNTFDFKGFELAFTFQGVTGNKIHLAGDTYMAANAAWYDNQTVDQLNSWKKPGDITDVPQARLAYSNGDQGRSSRYLSDGAYIKLRSLTLAYTLPQAIVEKAKFSNIRLYVQGQNLLTFTKYIGWDPEVSTDFAVDNITSGVDFYSAPQPRSITFGINLGL